MVYGVDGHGYSPHGIGYSLLLAPAALAGAAAGEAAGKILAAFTCAVLSAALFAVWFSLCTEVNGTAPGKWKFLLVAVGGMAAVYSKLPFDVTAAALLCTASLLSSMRGRDAAAGALLGAALLVRLDSIVFLPSLFAGRRSLRLVPGIAAALLVIAALNRFRFGSVFEDGHSQDPAMAFAPGAAGLVGLLASSGKGLVWFAPMVLPAIPRHRGWRLAMPLLLGIALHSQLYDWTGGTGWGPRFLFPALPAFLAPLAAPGRGGLPFKAAALWGVLLTLAAVWSNPCAVERSLGADSFDDPSRQAVIWSPARSPLLHTLAEIGSGAPDIFCVTVSQESRRAGAIACAGQAAWVLGALALPALSRSRKRNGRA
ncbi:MAG: hypothetical protein IT351_08590 [Candidatus Fermentibacter sp.]|nr:hypothetical protein [Candidatus Fermentibacter sp.]